MKLFRYAGWLALMTLASLMASCTSISPEGAEAATRYSEGDSADVVLRFYRWDSIYMTKPESREDGFLPVLTRESIGREIARHRVGRSLAVLIIGFTYSADQDSPLVKEWKALLAQQGFRRVVFLRAGPDKNIDGLPILYDSAIGAVHDPHGKDFATLTALAPAAGANAPDPSGHPIR